LDGFALCRIKAKFFFKELDGKHSAKQSRAIEPGAVEDLLDFHEFLIGGELKYHP
jgi:hypothetical protein